jgi:hypothetical protein
VICATPSRFPAPLEHASCWPQLGTLMAADMLADDLYEKYLGELREEGLI